MLAALAVVEHEVSAAITVDSGLAGVVVPAEIRTAAITSPGVLGVQTVEVEKVSAGMSGIASLSMMVAEKYAVAASFTGFAQLSAAAIGQTIARQRIDKSGHTPSLSSAAVVRFWASNPTYPATVASDGLQVVGSGTVTVSASVRVNSNSSPFTVYLRKNGAQIGSAVSIPNGASVQTITVPGVAAAAGDIIEMYETAGFFSGAVIAAADTWINISP